MKKNLHSFLFLCVAALCSTTLIAQTTLSTANNPTVGNFIYQTPTATGFNPGFSGPDVTWDFGDLVGTGTPIEADAVAATLSTNAVSFPDATIAMQEANGTETYYYGSTTGQGFYGTVATVNGTMAQLIYSDPQDLIQYPMTYGMTFMDPFTGTFTASGSTFTRSGTATVIADGAGKLITPAGTFKEVLRLKTEMQYSDVFMGQTLVTYTEERYTWYDANSAFPLLTFTILTANGQSSIFLNYLDASAPVGTNDLLTSELDMTIFPNPATDFVNINFTLEKNATVAINVLNLIGQKMKSISPATLDSGNQNLQIDVDGFATGTYFLQMEINGEIITNKLVIK